MEYDKVTRIVGYHYLENSKECAYQPIQFIRYLQPVSLQLPSGLSMLTSLTVGKFVYYAVVTVHAVATSKNISISIDIPLKSAGGYFDLYQVHSLHFSHKGIGKFVMIDKIFTYLTVAGSRQFFAMMKPYMLLQCTQD